MGVDPDIACGIVGNIGQLWLDGQFIDLQIHIEDILFSCNRFILCACSNFVKVLLKSEVKGESEHPIKQVTIRGISPEIFQLVLKAVYQGENELSTENMIEFWHAVHQLEIPCLVSKCETFIDSHMTPENFVNIYQNALLLKSRNVIHAAHHFVAKNFESFKELEILLQQPVSYIEEIIGCDSLMEQFQNHVVEFILKWVSYELCAGEAGPVSADSTVGDLSVQISEVTRNKHDSVEVIFQKPHATLGEDSMRSLSGQSLVRKQSLGKLLNQVRFADLRQDHLEMLTDNDLVMGSKETRDIVLQALKLVNSATTSSASTSVPSTTATSTPATFAPAASTSASSIDTECIVFVTKNSRSIICAYSLDSGDIFEFLSPGSVSHMHVNHNKLLCRVQTKSSFLLKIMEFPFSTEIHEICYVRSDSVLVGNFYYTLKDDKNMYRTNIKNGSNWLLLFPLPEHMSSPSLTVLNDNILYYNSTLKDGKQEVYCFNTNSRKHWLMMTCENEDCDFVTFIKGEELYIVYGNGMCINVSDYVISPFKAFSVSQYWKLKNKFSLWEFQCKIYGAVVHQDKLLVFGDFTSVSVSEIPVFKIPGLKTIKFVHLYDLHTKCYPLVIPKELLKRQM